MLHALLLTAMIGAPQSVFDVQATPQTVIKPDGFYIQWSDGSYAYPGSPIFDKPQSQTVFIVGPWLNSREAIYATLQSPTRQQIETALEKARATWAASKAVKPVASPFLQEPTTQGTIARRAAGSNSPYPATQGMGSTTTNAPVTGRSGGTSSTYCPT